MGKYAIFIVSALIFSLLTYSSALRNALFRSNTRTITSHQINQAYNIAQSAMMVAIKDIKENGNDSDFSPEEDDTYDYPASNSFANWADMKGEYNIRTTNQGDTLLVINSTGKYGESQYRVGVGLIKSSGGSFEWPAFDQAVHADQSISVLSGSHVYGNVSVNSTSYGAIRTDWQSPAISGNAFIGPGGVAADVAPSISQWHSNYIGGSTVSMPEELAYELPEFPPVPALSAGTSIKTEHWNDQTTFNLDNYTGSYIPEIAVNENRSMYLNVGDQDRTIYVGHLNMSNGHINILGSGNLEIHVVNQITMGSGSSINCSAQYWTDASNCSGTTEQVTTFYGGSSSLNFSNGTFFNGNMYIEKADLTLGGGNGFFGNIISGGDKVNITGGADAISRVIYAPNADVRLNQGGNLTGSIISKTFYSDGGTWVRYDSELDTDLPELGGNGGGTPTYLISYWK